MDKNSEQINVEEIMTQIRQEAKKKANREGAKSFSNEKMNSIGDLAFCEEVNERELVESVCYLNDNCEIPYYHPVSGGIVLRFIKKTIRRLIRFIVRRILNSQNEINVKTTRSLNNLLKGYRNVCMENEALHSEINSILTQMQDLEVGNKSLQENFFKISKDIEKGLNDFKERFEVKKKEYKEELESDKQIVQELIKRNDSRLIDLLNDIHQTRNEILDNKKYTRAIARELSRTRWSFIDYLESKEDSSSKEIECGICGYHAQLKTFETKEADCIFGGGHLKRFVCPKCGAIFGPLKFKNQSEAELSDDYVVNYAGYDEKDCTFKERFAFQMLLPKKDGVYLDYGCGRWSKTIQELREEGYEVYGYEPYSSETSSEYIITDKEILAGMRFDGIFSNDLLEHLVDPVAEMKFMKTLLLTPDSRMSHCTGCYLYKYEETRFHTYFFTGDSVSVLAKKAGLSVDRWAIEQRTKDPCYVYALDGYDFDETNRMVCSASVDSEIGISASPGGIIFGPYLTLPKGKHVFGLEISLPQDITEVKCRLTIKRGGELLQEISLHDGNNVIEVNLLDSREDLEFVMENKSKKDKLTIKKIVRIF